MNIVLRIASILIVLMLVTVTFQSAVAELYDDDPEPDEETRADDVIPGPFRELDKLVSGLLNATQDTNDTDGDLLPDSVEWIIGTDHNDSDSDDDTLDDHWEVFHNMNPNKIDSNDDGLADYFEVTNVNFDLDGNGIPNVWDSDNDGDGVRDAIDSSPNARTGMVSSLHIDMNTTGEPLYLSFELRTKNPDNMRLMVQQWDWPYDTEGRMTDMDGSKDDMTCLPSLILTSSDLPDQADVIDYAISIGEGMATLPLFPVWDMGNIVALKSRMYYPADPTRENLSLDLVLRWFVNGETDERLFAYQGSSGDYLSVAEDGSVSTNATELGANETLTAIHLGDRNWSFRCENDKYLSVGPAARISATADNITDSEIFEVIAQPGGKVALKGYNGAFVTEHTTGALSAVGLALGSTQKFTSTAWFGSYRTNLATYAEDFMLTSFSATESFGTDAALIYSDLNREIYAADVLLGYEFLNNASNEISDIPALLGEHDLDHSILTGSYDHFEEAAIDLNENLYKTAIDSLPKGNFLPITNVMEIRSSSLDLSELGTGPGVVSGPLMIEMDKEPMITTRTLRTLHYEGGVYTPVAVEDVIEDIMDWGLDEEGLAIMVSMVMLWSGGEQTVVRVGDEITTTSYPEAKTTIPSFIGAFKMDFKAVKVLFGICKNVRALYFFLDPVKVRLLLGSKAMFESGIKLYGSVLKASGSVKVCGTMGKTVSSLSKFFLYVGAAIAVGMAVWACVALGNELGWTGSGTGIAVSNMMLELTFAFLLIGLGMLFPVGTIIALFVGLLDLISSAFGKGIFEALIGKIMEKFAEWWAYTDERTTVDLDFVETTFTTDDKDDNGLTLGDSILFTATVDAIVTKTEHGSWDDVVESYIKPRLLIDTGNVWIAFRQATTTQGATVEDETAGTKTTTYEMAAIVKPLFAMVNFPVVVGLNTTYKVYYDDCWDWLGFIPDCSREYSEDSSESIIKTKYYDVLPSSINGFRYFRGIVSNDRDGDGLLDSEETETSTYMWDSDGDGLGDKFEGEIGSDPTMRDTDRDGFDDKYELQWGLNFTNQDSDGDGLNDFAESGGWVVDFNYYGTDFFWHVQSDPRTHDTDGDGVNDYQEYWCLLNPMSYDSNGDGDMDRAQDYWISEFAWNSTLTVDEGDLTKIEIDDEGHIYLMYLQKSTVSPYGAVRQGFVILNPNGTVNTTWSIPTDMTITDFDLGDDGYLYLIFWERVGYSYFFHAKKFAANGTEMEVLYLGDELNWRGCLAVDTVQGHFYLGGGEACETVVKLNSTGAVLDYYHTGIAGSLDFGWDGFLYATAQTYSGGKQYRVAKVDPVNDTVLIIGSSGNVNGTFDIPSDVAVDNDGYILAADYGNARVQKFDHRGKYVGQFNYTGIGDGMLLSPRSLCIDDDDNIYVLDENDDRIHKYEQSYKLIQVEQDQEFTDTDDDGLSDLQEEAGWEVVVVNTSAGLTFMSSRSSETYMVFSDPLSPDSDGDGLSDWEEYNLSSDPRSIDTDGDGVRDLDEVGLGTNITNCDSEGDGLTDGLELGFLSDPMKTDTDGEGLSDLEEFYLGSHPRETDSDGDSLDDAEESAFNSNPNNPDEDGDLAFDRQERELGTSPRSDDHDGDGLIDGLEIYYRTNATNGDSDGDGLSDGYEISSLMDPVNNDTDGDGLLDGVEVAMGYNPRSGDSDGDGIPDALDRDNEITLEGEIVVVFDNLEGAQALVDALSGEATVNVMTTEEFIADHTAARYILLVGRPDSGEGTAGALINETLADSGNILQLMLESASDSMAVRYGLWNNPQTVVMLSNVRPSDHIRVLGVFKSMSMDVTDRAVTVEYLNPRSCIIMDQADLVRTTDANLWAKLDNMETFSVEIELLDETTTTQPMSDTTGLGPVDMSMDKFWDVSVSENIQDEFKNVLLELYYTTDDLDRTGDGDADDPADLDESTLALYVLDEATGNWTPLSVDLDWVEEVGVDTTDVQLFGREYAGHMRTVLAHLSLFGIAGRRNQPMATLAVTGGDLEVTARDEVVFDGTASTGNGLISSFTWTFEYEGETVTLEGAEPVYTFMVPGEYEITLKVTDYLDLLGETTFTVTVAEFPLDPTVATAQGDLKIDEGKEVTFNGTTSTGNGDIVSYEWTFEYKGETMTLEGAEPVFTFKTPGTYTVTLTVTDSKGQIDDATFEVTVKAVEEDTSGLPLLLLIGILMIPIIVIIGRSRRGSRRGSRETEVEEDHDMDADLSEDESDDEAEDDEVEEDDDAVDDDDEEGAEDLDDDEEEDDKED